MAVSSRNNNRPKNLNSYKGDPLCVVLCSCELPGFHNWEYFRNFARQPQFLHFSYGESPELQMQVFEVLIVCEALAFARLLHSCLYDLLD